MSDAVAIGRVIREARLEKGLSLGQLAAAVGRSSSSVRRWERGEVPPAIGIIDDLAEVLELDPDELRSMRPQPDEPEPDPVEVQDSEPPRPITLEQPEISEVVEHEEAVAAQDATGRSPGFIADVTQAIREATSSWSGWIRGLLTVAVLIVMGLILIWALGELASALSEIWDSFDTEPTA